MITFRYFGGVGGEHDLVVEHYPAGEPLIRKPDSGGLINEINEVIVRTSAVGELVEALFFVDALRYRGKLCRHLILPYVPGARQDRLNDSGDHLFTLKSVAEMINARNFLTVTVLDPHSDVAPALIDRCVVRTAADVLWHHLDRGLAPVPWDVIIAPDAGAAKRAYAVAQMLKLPVIQGEKHRDVATGKLSGFALSQAAVDAVTWGANTIVPHGLVVDDICDGGGTFLGLAEVIARVGMTADLYVTHGLFTQGTEKLLDAYQTIYTTDSLPSWSKPGVTIIPTTEKYA
jgi:ribose-phosphate pyrophosphokinase